MTITVELLHDDALGLLQQLENLSILRLKKDKDGELKKTKIKISQLRGTLKTGLTVDEIDTQLKTIRNEWERDFS
jgi:hypothetical protein